MERKHKKTLALCAYFLVAAGTGCLVVPVSIYGAISSSIFGLLMAGLVCLARYVDETAHLTMRQAQHKTDLGMQTAAVSIIYVAFPAGVVALLHLLVPSLVVLSSGWQMFLGLIWFPLFLGSLLELRQCIRD
jgi:hypothetical protein